MISCAPSRSPSKSGFSREMLLAVADQALAAWPVQQNALVRG